MQHDEQCTDRCPWSVDKLFKLSYTYISDISTARSISSAQCGDTRRMKAETKNKNKNGDIV